MLTIEKLNVEFEKQYGKVVEGEQIDKDIDFISKSLNEFYSDKKIVVIGNDKTVESTVKNINDSLLRAVPMINVFEFGNNKTNAFASKIEEDYVIGVLRGTFSSLKKLFWSIVESDEFSEMPRLSVVNKNIMIEKLNQYCLDFLKYHEFAHIINGHCDYIITRGIKELCEDTNTTTDSGKGLILQTLEYDADCCAISSLINEEIRGYIYIFQNMGVAPIAESFINSFESFLCTVIISLYTLFQKLASTREYQNTELTKEKLEVMSHPVPGIRIVYIIINIGCILNQWKIFDKNQISRLIDAMFEELGKYIKISEYVVPAYYIKYSLNDLIIEQIQKVHDNWKNTREDLQKFTYAKLAEYGEFNYKEAVFGKE